MNEYYIMLVVIFIIIIIIILFIFMYMFIFISTNLKYQMCNAIKKINKSSLINIINFLIFYL
jgi:hypothetical protein